ncbi:hydrogen gas-evolving membrane-bound hydrogenase subunit E [Streptomyces oceani]|uniref:hydrogen gas-evolving membrane-bound hydrogenase subunit E n=1 Tax=Streptomyces oceani TaxID=1075402 RepID=UPI00087337BF|nr:hydrogen gas-evolving membrane-bound hydrogenase subunit E [Streptomyces oceani]
MLVLIAAHAVLSAVLPSVGRRYGRAAWWVATCVPLATLVWSLTQIPGVLGGDTPDQHFSWAPVLHLEVRFRLDGLALLMTSIVSLVGTLVLVYSHRYSSGGHGRESALLVAFAGAMIGLVTADNLLLLYVFWELTTIVSFLLIAGVGRTTAHRRAAEQALVTTAAGGLAMLLGFVMLGESAGTYRVSALVADPPRGGEVTAAVVLVLIGAFAKSAQMPLHAWLPAAMVAPTPVSAFLHAAAMVKAGVYLVGRFAPGFAGLPTWQTLVLSVGLLSLVAGAWQALREHDLKRVLAYGTISELGLLIMLFGHGGHTSALAGETMLLAHALFKSGLFLTTGAVDRITGTRDMRKLNGLGKRQPWLMWMAVLAAASMAGAPPLIGFLGHEAAFEAFLHPEPIVGDPDAPAAGYQGWVLAGLFVGAVLTVAYSARYLWGAFADRPGVPPVHIRRREPRLLAPVSVLAVLGVLLGVAYPVIDELAGPYADRLPSGPKPYHVALWHGFTPVLGLSVLALLLGLAFFRANRVIRRQRRRLPLLPGAYEAYWSVLDGLNAFAVQLTRRTQVGSLPVYLTVILSTVLLLPGSALLFGAVSGDVPMRRPALWESPIQATLGVVVLAAAGALVAARHRLTGVLLAGAVGYGVAGLFLLHGAPDLALAQFLVESLTLIIIVLVLRGLPADLGTRHTLPRTRLLRATLALALGTFFGLFALVVSSARTDPTIARAMIERVTETGSYNVVNAILVDYRAMDTFGEIAVLLVAALGSATLLGQHRLADSDQPWRPPIELPEHRKSLLLDAVVRLLFPCVLVLSVYLLFSGHWRPGGGFAGGLVAALAFALRYLTGGWGDPRFSGPLDPRIVAGGGLALAGAAGLGPVVDGSEPLTSTLVQFDVAVLGKVKLATSLFFDIGVYLVVAGVGMLLISAAGPAREPVGVQEPEGASGPTGTGQLVGSEEPHASAEPRESPGPHASAEAYGHEPGRSYGNGSEHRPERGREQAHERGQEPPPAEPGPSTGGADQ